MSFVDECVCVSKSKNRNVRKFQNRNFLTFLISEFFEISQFGKLLKYVFLIITANCNVEVRFSEVLDDELMYSLNCDSVDSSHL